MIHRSTNGWTLREEASRATATRTAWRSFGGELTARCSRFDFRRRRLDAWIHRTGRRCCSYCDQRCRPVIIATCRTDRATDPPLNANAILDRHALPTATLRPYAQKPRCPAGVAGNSGNLIVAISARLLALRRCRVAATTVRGGPPGGGRKFSMQLGHPGDDGRSSIRENADSGEAGRFFQAPDLGFLSNTKTASSTATSMT